jgi:hypothetical protein
MLQRVWPLRAVGVRNLRPEFPISTSAHVKSVREMKGDSFAFISSFSFKNRTQQSWFCHVGPPSTPKGQWHVLCRYMPNVSVGRRKSRFLFIFFPTRKVSLVAVLHFTHEASVCAGEGLCQFRIYVSVTMHL